jgi:hypothetical protein
VSVVDRQGAPVSLSNATMTLTVKRSPRDLSVLFAGTGNMVQVDGQNTAVVSMTPADSVGWRPGTLCYDVMLETGDGDLNAIIPTSPLYLLPAVFNGPAPDGAGGSEQTRGTVPAPNGPYPLIPKGTPVAIIDGELVVADAGDPSTMPAAGLYTGASSNLVRTDGIEEGLSGLPTDTSLFVAVGGGITGVAPSASGEVSQRIGASIGTTNAFVEPGVAIRFP